MVQLQPAIVQAIISIKLICYMVRVIQISLLNVLNGFQQNLEQ